ncbi:Formate dehydrogenase H [Planctomycetes bacterium Pan216]|uniref:Formate dehydrogenase H n=1 Tax=Kolteria novifilia TaxID=2527975 RepID=A0A518AYA1_9BACT|nr:Formate dehydrogenase H [Planctomycetes bacterium Pan216]
MSSPEHNENAPNDKTTEYHHPAGGMGALVSSGQMLLESAGIVDGVASLLRVNQPQGFDCPGCAWPEPGKASRMEFCENGIKAVTFETTGKRVTPEFFAKHTVTYLNEQTDHWLENQGRLTHPMRYNAETDHYEPIEWKDAFALIGSKLQGLNHPNEAIFYTSGRTSNEAAFLYQLLARRFGTNNMPDCSNMCHESSGSALTEAIGIGKGTVTIADFDEADAIFVFGQNPGTNHPRMLSELEKASERGARIVSFNPLREPGLLNFTHPKDVVGVLTGRSTPISTHYYQVTVGGDLAALKGILKVIVEAEDQAPGTVFDHDFLKEHTSGLEELLADIHAADWDAIERESGLTREQLRESADVYLASERVIICWAMGLTQHKHAVATIQYVVNLLLLRGMIGKPGAGACPVRGHSNVQGDRTMGIVERPAPAFLEGLKRAFGFEPPSEHGVDVVGAINAMLDGKGKVFIGMGGNFVAATPDTMKTSEAMNRCVLTVHVSTKLNRSHVVHGKDALILPCLGRTELDVQASGPQKVTVEDSMSQVHASRGKKAPASPHLLSEPAIIAGIANATLVDSGIAWDEMVRDYRLIRQKIAEVVPVFAGYEQRIDANGGFYLGNSARERNWKTATGKARFMAHPLPELQLPAGQLRLMTIRSHDQFNTTVYALNDRYRGIKGKRMVLFMNPEDIHERGLKAGDKVDITSHTQEDGLERHARGFEVIAYDIPRGCAAAYFPETNVLVSKDSFAEKSRTPLSKFIPITVAGTGS